jgi:hypothetical protein
VKAGPAPDPIDEPEFDPAAAKEFRDSFRRLAEEAPQKIAEIQRELIELLAPYDAFDVLANVWMVNTPTDPDNYRESDQESLMAIPDYLLLLTAQRGSREPTVDPVTPSLMRGELLEEINGHVRSVLELSSLHLNEAVAHADESSFEQLRRRLVGRRMIVQGPGFPFQEREVIGRLFGSEAISATLLDTIGFTATDALALAEAVVGVGLDHFYERSRRVKSLPKLVDTAFARGDGEQLEKLGLDQDELKSMSRAQLRKTLKELGAGYAFLGLGTTMAVTAAQVAAAAQVDVVRATAFLDRFSIPFSQPPKTLLGMELISGRERPILRDASGNYLLASHMALLWSIRPALETSLKSGPAWHRFERGRAEFVEGAAIAHFEAALPGSRAYRSVTFEVEEGGEKRSYEIDGLLICDTVMLIVEGKSGALSQAGRRGSPARLEKHLRELLVKAAGQADRAKRALGDPDHEFIASDGTRIELPEHVSEIFPIVVTLEDLSEVTTVIWELQSAGLLPETIPTPWALSLFELELIADLTEYAAMLIQFLRRRARLNVLKRVRASDELDWWVYYLERGLYFDKDLEGEEAPDGIFLQSMTDPIDAYYLWKRGVRTKRAPKPRQKLNGGLRSLLDALHAAGRTGYLEASAALLDLDLRGREEVVRGFRRIREMTSEDGGFHNFSFVVGGEKAFGISFFTGPGDDLGPLEDRLRAYSLAKKYQCQADRWIGFGWAAGTRYAIDLVALVLFDWRQEDELDDLLEEMNLDPSAPVVMTDGGPQIVAPKSARRPPARRRRHRP